MELALLLLGCERYAVLCCEDAKRCSLETGKMTGRIMAKIHFMSFRVVGLTNNHKS